MRSDARSFLWRRTSTTTAGERTTRTRVLSFTPRERLADAQDRPYFLWDCDLTLSQFREGLADPDPEVRA